MPSCFDSSTSERPIDFKPRKCNYVYVTQGLRKPVLNVNLELVRYEYWATKETTFQLEDFGLIVSTYSDSVDSLLIIHNTYYFNFIDNLDTPLSHLELQLEKSYRDIHKSSSNGSSTSSIAYDAPPIEIEYRTTGVRSITVSAVDVSLFGIEAGQPLNQHLVIAQYDPDFIASYESESLLYGFTDIAKPATLDGWMALLPLAQPIMNLRFSHAPNELPVTTAFRVVLVTEDDVELTYTTVEITITQ